LWRRPVPPGGRSAVERLTVGYDANVRRRRYVYARTKADALAALARLQHAALTGMLAHPERLTVAAFLGRWLDDAARPAVREATATLYASLVRNHIVPRIGGVLLSRLTPAHVQGLLAAMEQAGASPKLRLLVYGVLHRALRQAVQWGMVPRNVCEAVSRPRVPRAAVAALASPQVAALLEAAGATASKRSTSWPSPRERARTNSWGCTGRMRTSTAPP
jgi:integrase